MGKKLLSALLCVLVLSSCSFMALDPEGLLEAPMLNTQQAEVYQALQDAMDMGAVSYKYPRRGDYRSPFIFYDMDGDGLDEAIVFYSFNGEETGTRATILRQHDDDGWYPFEDFSVAADQIDFVQFSHLYSPHSSCMIIGWLYSRGQTSRVADSILGVYSLASGKFREEISQPYTDYEVGDFDGDGLDEIVAIERSAERSYRIVFLRNISNTSNSISLIDSLPLAGDTDTVLQMTTGAIWNGATAVYVDVYLSNTATATEIFRVSGQGLELLCGEDPDGGEESLPADFYSYTFRDEQVLSRDFDSDGVVEVPYPKALPGYSLDVDGEAPLKLTQLMQLTSQGFVVEKSAVINESQGYLVYFPEYWQDQVTVERESGDQMWKFYKVDIDSGETTVELLRIQTRSSTDFTDMFTTDYIALGTRGNLEYYAYIPRTVGESLAVTEEMLLAMFAPLP